MRNKVLAFSIFLCGCFVFGALFQPLNLQPIEAKTQSLTSAKCMAVIEAESKRVLFSKCENEKVALASTTKIVTALTVIKHCHNLDEKFVVDDRAVGVEGTSLYLVKGEMKTARELLYGIMLPSGNDGAMALAIKIGGSKEGFSRLMNKTAKECGAENSNFVNPHGLDEKGHQTTALDLAKITAVALKNEIFKEICSSQNATISGAKESEVRHLKNKNKLLYLLDGCIGVKTGYTGDAGRCLVSAAKRDGMQVVCVVLNCGPMFEESTMLINKAFKDYKIYELLSPYHIVKKIIVENGEVDNVKVFSVNGFCYPLTMEEYLMLNYDYDLPEKLNAPIKKEEIVGDVKIL
ncbi:MAG: D-alanyl-D-alanine carboxypeptidase family protein, partial [Clostridia bacterium]